MNIWGFLTATLIGSIARRVLAALGIGAVAYLGFDTLLSWVVDQVRDYIGDLPLAALQLAGLASLDIAINIVFSAYATIIGLMVLKRLVRA